jgi:hypothetical protein
MYKFFSYCEPSPVDTHVPLRPTLDAFARALALCTHILWSLFALPGNLVFSGRNGGGLARLLSLYGRAQQVKGTLGVMDGPAPAVGSCVSAITLFFFFLSFL